MTTESKTIKVLYIEDDLSSRVLIGRILARPPFHMLEAVNGIAGLNMAIEHRPDLILMDIQLPDINGTELTTKIKNTVGLEKVVIVAITANASKDVREMTLVAGCDGFLTKPVDVQKFPEQLLQFVSGKRDVLNSGDKEIFHSKYEVSLVDHLTGKVLELEEANTKLAVTSRKMRQQSNNLENILRIVTRLQACTTATELKKMLVDKLADLFHYDRCIFFDVEPEDILMRVQYARGLEKKDWEEFSYPFHSNFFKALFEEKHLIFIPRLSLIDDQILREKLRDKNVQQFVFAYLGTPPQTQPSKNINEGIQPLLKSVLPRLRDQKETDVDLILEHLQEYLASEALYRGGFVYIDNYKSQRPIHVSEFRFLESLFRTAGYMYQNLLLMEELRLLFIRAEKEAITDPLTNLFNYRYFIQQLNQELNRNKRHNSKFSLIMLDIDYFKRYNDALGHQVGDQILKKISQLLLENTRKSDVVCRYGGEEFVIISPELTKSGARALAEKLRIIVATTAFPHIPEFPDNRLTISLGISTFPADGENAFRLVRNADLALYAAKEGGRNLVRVAKPAEKSARIKDV